MAVPAPNVRYADHILTNHEFGTTGACALAADALVQIFVMAKKHADSTAIDLTCTASGGVGTITQVVESAGIGGTEERRAALFECISNGTPGTPTFTVDMGSGSTAFGDYFIEVIDFGEDSGTGVQRRSGQHATKDETDAGGATQTHTTGTLPAAADSANEVVVFLGTFDADPGGPASNITDWNHPTGTTVEELKGNLYYRTGFTGTSLTISPSIGVWVLGSNSVIVEYEEASSPQSVDVDTAVLTLTAVDVTLAASSAATVAVDSATVTLTAVALTLAGSSPVTADVDAAALQLSGVDPTLDGADGEATIAVDVATLTLIGVDVDLEGGEQIVDVDVAVLTLTAVEIIIAGSGTVTATVDTATLTLSGVDVEGETGAATVTVDPAILTLTGETPTMIGVGDASTTIDPAILTMIGVAIAAFAGTPPYMTGSRTTLRLDPERTTESTDPERTTDELVE